MTRPQHYSAPSSIPVYALAFLSDNVLAYAGGGGAGRSGVSNAIRIVRIQKPSSTISDLAKADLSRDEDAPMCLDANVNAKTLAAGINSVPQRVKDKDNETLRLFSFEVKEQGEETSYAIEALKPAKALQITDPEHYQRVLTFAPNGKLLASASTSGQVAVQRFPSLEPLYSTPATSKSDFGSDELFDASFSPDSSALLFASANKIRIYSTDPSAISEDDAKAGGDATSSSVGWPVVQTIQNPALGGGAQGGNCTFRAARFGRKDTASRLFTVVNAAGSGGGKKKKDRKSFVTAWNTDTWELVQTRKISDKPVTAFDVSSDGRLLAYGSSDLSVGVLDAKTLRPVTRILDAHGFPSTCVRFSPDGRTLVSASADNTLRVIDIPEGAKAGEPSLLVPTLALAVILVLIAIYIQSRLAK